MDLKNIRNLEVTTSSGTDVKDTDQLSGLAKEGPQMRETNEVIQYTTGTTQMGMLGGKPSFK